jgi:hypothetical protein
MRSSHDAEVTLSLGKWFGTAMESSLDILRLRKVKLARLAIPNRVMSNVIKQGLRRA